MKHCIVFLLSALTCINLAAKPKDAPAFNAHDLSITWEPVQNNYKTPDQSLNAITITNNGKNTFPAAGWKMYFNCARLITPATVSGNAKIDFVNGDLFSLTPTATFTEIKPGQSLRIEYIADEPVVNITDGPDGFYVVWDNQPDKGYNTGAWSIKPFKPNYVGLITPAIIYDQNKNIQDLPETQLTKVFPTPVSYKETGGVLNFKADHLTEIPRNLCFCGNKFPDFESLDNYLENKLNTLFKNTKSPKLLAPPPASGKGYVFFEVDTTLKPEAYKLKVDKDITISGSSTSSMEFFTASNLYCLLSRHPLMLIPKRKSKSPVSRSKMNPVLLTVPLCWMWAVIFSRKARL